MHVDQDQAARTALNVFLLVVFILFLIVTFVTIVLEDTGKQEFISQCQALGGVPYWIDDAWVCLDSQAVITPVPAPEE